MAKVFLSYAHSDCAAAIAFGDALKAGGTDIWLDRWEVEPGDSIVERINRAISTSDFLIVLLSPASVKSRWVKEEMAAATVRVAERGAFLIPVLLEDCEIPPLLAHRRYVNLRDEPDKAIAEILNKLRKHDQATQRLHDISKSILSMIFANSARRIDQIADEDQRRREKADLAALYRDVFADLEVPANLYHLWFEYCCSRGMLEWDVIGVIGEVCKEGAEETDYATKQEASKWLLGVLKKSIFNGER